MKEPKCSNTQLGPKYHSKILLQITKILPHSIIDCAGTKVFHYLAQPRTCQVAPVIIFRGTNNKKTERFMLFNTKTWSWRLRLHNIKKMLVCLKNIKREMDYLYFPVKNVEDSSWLARGSNLVKCCQCKRLLCLQVVSKFLVIQSQDKVYNTIYCKSLHKVLIWLDWGFVILQTNDFNQIYGRVSMFRIPD